MNLNTNVVLEFRDICKPFLIRCFCREFPVQDVFCNELRICSLPGTPFIIVFDRRFDAFFSADSKHSFVIRFDSMVTFQIIPYSSITLVRAFHVDFFNFISYPFVFYFISRNAPVEPFIVSRTAYMTHLAKCYDGISMLFMLFFDCLIALSVPDQAQPRLLSISSSFFKKDASISARSFSARRILFSARSLSNSDISSNGFARPRLSLSASTPPASYLTV